MPTDAPVTLLLVDDRPESLLTLEAVLAQPGYHLVTASSGPEAFERLALHDVAIILLDVQMPDIDGFETARRIKQHGRYRDIPIIFITAISKDQTHVFRGYESGAIDYLAKPFDDHVLRSKVAVIVELFKKSRRIQEQERALAVANAELHQEIAQREKAQAALREAHDKLEQKVADRTAALEAFNQALRDEVDMRRRAQEELETSLREKEVLLREIHHRVKNNLQVVSSLLSLQSNYIEDRQMLQLFEESRNRIRSMALVHEALYSSTSLSQIDMTAYVRDLTSQLVRSYAAEHIRVRLRVDPVVLAIDTAIPCGLMLNELMSNAFKHGFPDRREGDVFVELSKIGQDRFLLTIQDNGVGIPPHIDLVNTSSLGLRLVDALVSQLQGRVQLDRIGGTTYTIEFSSVPQAVGNGHSVAV